MTHSQDIKWLRNLISVLLISVTCGICAQEGKVLAEPGEERLNSQHKPVELMDAMELDHGMVIADIGAGRGRMTVFFADRVGKKGLVLANDINETALDYLKDRCERNGFRNVKTFLGTVTDPGLPVGKADILFMISTYHHLEKPVELMRKALPALKPDGRLIIVERDPVKVGHGNSENTARPVLIKQMTEAGYEHVRTDTGLLERDNIYYFRIPKSPMEE